MLLMAKRSDSKNKGHVRFILVKSLSKFILTFWMSKISVYLMIVIAIYSLPTEHREVY